MKTRLAILYLLAVFLSGCVLPGRCRLPEDVDERLRALDARLDEAERIWMESIDDPWTEPEVRRIYFEMQDICRSCSRSGRGFATVEQKELCDRVRYPYKIYFNELKIRVNRLDEQIFEIDKEGTVANEYVKRPSRDNLEKLRNIFYQVHRYFVGWPYTWTRYINKYKFQKSRLEHFRKEFIERDREYGELASDPDSPAHAVKLARRRAEFAFNRLKKEYVTNDLPPAGEVNAFYRAETIDDYHRLLAEEEKLAEERKREGREKEVVIFVHGLSETRGAWGKFPLLLSREDRVNPEVEGRYFKVYVFSYDTVEDSKSVEGFKRELAGFVSDIIRDENVEKVHLVGHSFGSVLCLKYLIHESDELLQGIDRGDPARVAEALIDAYRNGRFKQTVKSFISIAGSLSGSEIANIAEDRFIPRERLFRHSLPPYRRGVPGYGDIQVRENQIGSEVNLSSFRRLDIQCPLDPEKLLGFLPREKREDDASLRRALAAEQIPMLCIIGDPVKIQTIFQKEGLLKLGEVRRILFLEGIGMVLDSFRRDEDDGLVKSYSANINHSYLLTGGEDIGYRGASTRYTAYGHYSICRVDSRDHPTYRYVVSFLNGNLIPQLDASLYNVRRFAILLKVFPEGIDPAREPEAFFAGKERTVYLRDRKLDLPALRVDEATAEREGGGECADNVRLGAPNWNWRTGVRFSEGKFVDRARGARVTLRLRADGYREKAVTVPVRPGEVTYAVNVILEKERD